MKMKMKMKMEGEIVSKESIKPSSPTPQNKKIYKLSLFDQIVPPIFVPLVLYFPPSKTHSLTISQTTQKLKLSLSETLSHFYPLAGRIKDSLSIDCNDEGVLFIVAKFDYRLSDFLENPNPIACRDHIPSQLSWDEPGPGSHVAMVQVNHFACGGVAIGSLFLHKVVDGATIGTFMKAWGTTTRDAGDQTLFFSDYSAHSFFPQNESMQRESHLFSAMRQYFKFGKTVMRRYVFDSSAIATLRAKIRSDESTKRAPTRVETVSAYLWKCFMAASQSPNQSTSVVTHAVNMRRKAETPFPDESFGNYGWLVPASTTNNDENGDMNHLFSKVRKAISKVDVDFVKRMEGDAGFSGYTKNLEDTWSEFPEEADYLAITSWCNFGLYSVDFGWGRAVWMSKCDGGSDVELPFINVLWLMDTRDGDGIEAWLTLDEQIFSNFSQIKELHHLALVDPSPSQIIEDSEPFKKPSF